MTAILVLNLLLLTVLAQDSKVPAPFNINGYTSIVDECCQHGLNYGIRYHQCEQVSRHAARAITYVDKTYEQSCKVLSQECCQQKVADYQCMKGQTSARYFQPCNLYQKAKEMKDRTCRSETTQTCCHCCWIGLKLHQSGETKSNPELCTEASVGMDSHCKSSFLTCCKEGAIQGVSRYWKKHEDIKAIATAAQLARIRCKEGYIRDQVSGQCKDINECAFNPCQPGYACLNSEGSYQCQRVISCGTGYYLAENNTCLDINECESASTRCPPRTKCMNRPGSFRCVAIECPSGFEGDAAGNCRDVDECEKNVHKCPRAATCVNSEGAFTCKCQTGYKFWSHLNQCRDINECRKHLHDCRVTQRCINVKGGFKCVSRKKRCRQGFVPDKYNRICRDVNECQDPKLNTCAKDERCINLRGDFRCEARVSCQNGTRLNVLNNVCEDIDECRRRMHTCKSGQRCVNTFGAFECVTDSCNKGYKHRNTTVGDYKCVDIDECKDSIVDPCGKAGRCRNFIGSYTCHCHVGYEFDQGEGTCADIDECGRDLHSCNYHCNNTVGAFECSCPPGFTVDKTHKNKCTDIDECKTSTSKSPICMADESCFNTLGAHHCINIKCPDGYTLDKLRNGLVCHRDCIYLGAAATPNCSEVSAIYYPSKAMNSLGRYLKAPEKGSRMTRYPGTIALQFATGADYRQRSTSTLERMTPDTEQYDKYVTSVLKDYPDPVSYYDPTTDTENTFQHRARGRYEFLLLKQPITGPKIYLVKIHSLIEGGKYFERKFYTFKETQLRYFFAMVSEYDF